MRRPLLFWSFCLVVLLAILHYRSDASADGGPPDGQSITITGWVCQKDETSFILKIQNDAANLRQDNQNDNQNDNLFKTISSGIRADRILCEYEASAELILGSTVVLEGSFYNFSVATNQGEFDYARYYHSAGYAGRLRNVSVIQAVEPAVRWQEGLYRLRCYWENRLYEVFPEKEASVMGAILLGDKSGVDAQVKELYQRNGIIHILSISGLHITLIGMGLYRLLRRAGLPVWFAAVMSGGILLLYGVMTGLGVSACRAIGMFLLRMLAELWGRTYDMLTAMGVAAAGMVCYHPAWLEHMGFLLSFSSIMGVGALLPTLSAGVGRRRLAAQESCEVQNYCGRLRRRILQFGQTLWESLRQSLVAGFSITLTTLPVQLWFAYEIPVYSVLLNAVVLPLMSVVMATGLFVMTIPGTGICGTVDVLILDAYEALCRVFEKMPETMWNPGRPAVWQIVVYFLLWGLAVFWGARMRKRQTKSNEAGAGKRKKTLLGPAVQFGAFAVALIVLGLPRWYDDRITFLDVGQGDCICVQTSSGEVYLFDCGSSSRSNVGEKVLIPFLKYHGIREIDAVLVSHGDSDHTNGIAQLLELSEEEHIRIKQMVFPGIDTKVWREELGELCDTVDELNGAAEIVMSCVSAGDSWQSSGSYPVQFLCLHPAADGKSAGGNEGSACFYLEFGQGQSRISVLLTGDVEGTGEQELISELQNRGIGAVTLLKVAHHGSKYSTDAALLELIQPRIAVVSCGRNNSYGHPHTETLERLEAAGSAVYRTDKLGEITLSIEDGSVELTYFCDE